MKRFKVIALLCFLSILSCKENITEAQSASVKKVVNEKVVAADFKSKTEGKQVQLIDVRTPKEYAEGYINKAKNINVFEDDFLEQMNKLDKNKAVYLYCRSGRRSANAANQLKNQGFTEIYDLQGGILDWKKNNLELVK